ncbi:type II toxin-antitoxin system YoeB family toxin [Opitutia bacterium ISCC 51]|nr:type II toxin-antitoxin system YoeB family toxin [Opitutae bacterium ISCC 51]QXD29093.1 type II toxin-antitoxin system YoeB family toxin [Opitutae bacterium ISCC 52]
MVTRFHLLIKDILRSTHEGIGKLKPLRHNLSGNWSQRISEEHRIAYKPFYSGPTFVQIRDHYKGCIPGHQGPKTSRPFR